MAAAVCINPNQWIPNLRAMNVPMYMDDVQLDRLVEMGLTLFNRHIPFHEVDTITLVNDQQNYDFPTNAIKIIDVLYHDMGIPTTTRWPYYGFEPWGEFPVEFHMPTSAYIWYQKVQAGRDHSVGTWDILRREAGDTIHLVPAPRAVTTDTNQALVYYATYRRSSQIPIQMMDLFMDAVMVFVLEARAEHVAEIEHFSDMGYTLRPGGSSMRLRQAAQHRRMRFAQNAQQYGYPRAYGATSKK